MAVGSFINRVRRVFSQHHQLKLVIVVRQDLKMGKGKIASQCSHAAVSAYKKMLKCDPQTLMLWESTGQPKIILQCKDGQELDALHEQSRAVGLSTSLVRDAGRTQLTAGSSTVLSIGPGSSDKIDIVSGQLKLL